MNRSSGARSRDTKYVWAGHLGYDPPILAMECEAIIESK
jgi:hypothetical protein